MKKAEYTDNAPGTYVIQPIGRYLFLQFFSLGVYSLYWWYHNWRALDTPRKRPLLCVMKTILSPIIGVKLLSHISKMATAKRLRIYWDPIVLSFLYVSFYVIALLYFAGFLQHTVFILILLLRFSVLIPVQHTLNALHKSEPNLDPTKQSFKIKLGLLILGTGLWGIFVFNAYQDSLPNLNRARLAYKTGSYQSLYRYIEPAAERGNAHAQAILGYLYKTGLGVPHNIKYAQRWLERAAQQDLPSAQFSLGQLYQSDEGGPPDYEKAIEWYNKATTGGNADAATNLAVLYDRGLGVPKDPMRAIQYYKIGVEHQVPLAEYYLARHYMEGDGVAENKAFAYQLLVRSGAKNTNCALNDLGIMYAQGDYVHQDLAKAQRYFRQAISGEYEKFISKENQAKHISRVVRAYICYMLSHYAQQSMAEQAYNTIMKLDPRELNEAKIAAQAYIDLCHGKKVYVNESHNEILG